MLSDNKRDNKIGVGIIVGAMIMIGLAGAIGPDAAAALLIFGGIAFAMVCVIVSFTNGGKKNNSTVTTTKTTPTPKATPSVSIITMPKKDVVSDTSNFDVQLAEMEKQVNSMTITQKQPEVHQKQAHEINTDIVNAVPIPHSSPMIGDKV